MLVLAVPAVRLLSGCGAPDVEGSDGGSNVSGLAVGAACDRDSRCASMHCECVDFDCTQRMCAAAECLCGYGTSGSCTDPLRTGIKDPDDCDGASASCRGLNSCMR